MSDDALRITTILQWSEIHPILDREFACRHEVTRVVRSVFRNGTSHLRPQCVRCGMGLQYVSAAGMTSAERNAVPDFDVTLRAEWNARIDARRDELYEIWMSGRSERQRQYREVDLQSSRWKALRDLVLKRDDYLCQGCLNSRACDVHHLTYENRGAEFAFELVAVCRPCHDRLHPPEEGISHE